MVFRKAHDSQLIGIRAALRGGASWEQIAEALGVPAAPARRCFNEAIAERLDSRSRSSSLRPGRRARPYRPDHRARSTASTRSRPAASVGAWYRKRNLNWENRRAEHVPSVVVP
ncbi:hypothetical protein SAMN05660657_05585 [Geodermatophilus amargosae]|uniref:Uncharacterized protein n=1 Tax=Geodermatophilus amargosae TaxID=1296565 RepID=A0A1I7DBM8_9ACTN|nr:hypothetical protein SAMN05660657_05585 [Geodermatophilus amargosae]